MAEALVSLLGFYALCALPCLCVFPWIRSLFARYLTSPENQTQSLPVFVPALCTGLTLFLLAFSLWSRAVPHYLFSVPLALGSVVALSVYFVKKHPSPPGFASWGRLDTFFLAMLVFLHTVLLFLRSYFPNIHFEPGRLGAEKMFNFQCQQAFVHGSGFPPENLWFAGEHIVYYVLPKSLAGLVSKALFFFLGNSSGGTLYHISDTFFYSLALTALAGFSFIFLRYFNPGVKEGKLVWAAVFIGMLPFFAAPARALSQAFADNVELWSLSRIIENTVNEYPFWNFLWADNHAHSAVIFIQFVLWFWLLVFLMSEKARESEVRLLIAAGASTVLLSHAGSVLINVVAMGTVVGGAFVNALAKRQTKHFLQNLSYVVSYSVFLSLPYFYNRAQPGLVWYFVTPKYASKFSEYLNIHFLIGTLLPLFLVLASTRPIEASNSRLKIMLTANAVALVVSFVAGWPVVGFALVLACGGTVLLLQQQDSDKSLLFLKIAALYASSLYFIFPELVAANFNMGEQYMRYNTLFRFLFESFYFVPLLWVFALSSLFSVVADSKLAKRVTPFVVAAVVILFGFAQYKTFKHRISRDAQTQRLDGAAFFAEERPVDSAIANFLAIIPARVLTAEDCGIHPRPAAYTVAGRIAAFSARPSLCGWAHHISNFQSEMNNPGFRGTHVYSHLLKRNEWINTFFEKAEGKPVAPEKENEARAGFKKLGVTHIVLGQLEKTNHPAVTLPALGQFGKVVFEKDGFGVVEINLP